MRCRLAIPLLACGAAALPALTGAPAATGLTIATEGPPQAGDTVIARVVSGTVLVREPGRSSFTRLRSGDRVVDVDAQLDAARGRVRVTAETGRDSAATRSVEYFGGRFQIRQPPARPAPLSARLTGPLAGCGSGAGATTGRGVWAATSRAGATFRTTGRLLAATVRAPTVWFVGDRCDGTTLATVRSGRARVADFAADFEEVGTIVLDPGERWIARPRR